MLLRSTLFFVLLTVVLAPARIMAQTRDAIERLWLNEEQTAKIQIYKATDGKYYGKIVWLKVPTIDGKPKVDNNNPDKKRRNDPLNGLVLLRGFKKTDANTYDDGTIYDPKNGKTYSCVITMKGTQLDVRGYVGISLLGRTTKWTATE